MGFLSKLFQNNVLARVKITARGDKQYFDISTPNNPNLIVLLAAYFTKVRWLLETEPEAAMERMKNYYDEALNNYPNMQNYNVFTPAAFGDTQVFTIEAIRRRESSVGVVNTIPNDSGALDLVDSCFVLLEEIFNKSNESDKELLFASLLKLRPLIFLDEMDTSKKGLTNAYKVTGALGDMITGHYWEYLD